MNAQGEDVVAGIRTPQPLEQLKEARPEIHAQLVSTFERLENHFKDMQDVEFTMQEERLWMLQTRTGKRTGFAAVRIAVDLVEEGLIDEENSSETRRARTTESSAPSCFRSRRKT